jgi:ribonucleotide reductase alpha subunit
MENQEEKTTKQEKPFYWLNDHSRIFLNRGYLEEGEEPLDRYRQIAERAEELLNIKGFADKFYDYLGRGFYSLASPVISNFGKKRGLPVSCFNSYIPDNMTGILEKVGEVGIMNKMGGGTSGYFGDLRPRGASINSGGSSSGPAHFMELFDTVANVVSQGSQRRGAFAAYLPVEHPDIEEFLHIRSVGHQIQNMSIGVTITDKWMEGMIAGDKDKRKIWAAIIKKRFETGYPYITFIDNVNNANPQAYKDLDLKVKSKNLCVTGDTKIEILINEEKREIQIKDLDYYLNKYDVIKVKSFDIEKNQETFSEITAFAQTGEATELIEIEDENGNILRCTEDHPIYTKNRGYVLAKDLKETDNLELVQGILPPKNGTIKIKKIKQIEPVYDITVKETENFYANNILVHNCNEITLFSDENNSFVCVLSSLNLYQWEEIQKTDAIETLIYFLDAVNEEFVQKTSGMKFMETANNFAKNHRALGMGALGWHSFLQSKGVSFESMEAKLLNSSIWKTIRERADRASEELAQIFGEAPILKGYGRRNTHTLAVAPTTSSATILGQVSPSIEPFNSNYYVKKLAKGSFTFKNPFLKEVLKKHNKDDQETWKSILVKGGSVQHLSFLSEEEKNTFKTFGEISQKEIVIQAAQRQKYIDQGQSLNLMIPSNTKPKQVSELLIEGWKLGVKGFYYQRGTNPVQDLSRNLMECKSCES